MQRELRLSAGLVGLEVEQRSLVVQGALSPTER